MKKVKRSFFFVNRCFKRFWWLSRKNILLSRCRSKSSLKKKYFYYYHHSLYFFQLYQLHLVVVCATQALEINSETVIYSDVDVYLSLEKPTLKTEKSIKTLKIFSAKCFHCLLLMFDICFQQLENSPKNSAEPTSKCF